MVQFVITCYVPTFSFLALLDGSNGITFFPPSLFDALSRAIGALEPAISDIHFLSCSANIVCIKCALIIQYLPLSVPKRYCSVVIRLLYMCLGFCVIVWLFWDYQFTVYKSGPDLYPMHTLY